MLFWGVFGALVLRAGFIFAGVALIAPVRVDALRLRCLPAVHGRPSCCSRATKTVDPPEQAVPRRSFDRFVPTTSELHGQKMFVRVDGRRWATPLFAVLLLVEVTDVLFAVDSVPAVLAVSKEQFIVFTSNAFAIMGLRSLYFMLADMHARFSYLQQGLAIILAFVGVKMIISRWYHIETPVSLLVIVIVLVASVSFSLRQDSPPIGHASRWSRSRPTSRRAADTPRVTSRPWRSSTRTSSESDPPCSISTSSSSGLHCVASVATGSGLCPFHAEKHRSFNVRERDRPIQVLRLRRGGDVFTFVREIEHVDFVGAVEQLAGQGRHRLRYTTGGREPRPPASQAADRGRRGKAVEWYHHRLLTRRRRPRGP